MATDPFDVTNSDGDNSTANFFRNLQAFGGATMAAANTYGPNGFLTYGAGPMGAVGVGLNAAAQQSRENATAQANIGKSQAEAQGLRQQNQLFPLQMQMAKAQMQLLNNVTNGNQPAQSGNSTPNTETPPTSNGGMSTSASLGGSNPTPQTVSKPVNNNLPLSGTQGPTVAAQQQAQTNNTYNIRPTGSSSGFIPSGGDVADENLFYKDMLSKIDGSSPRMQAKLGSNYQPTLRNIISVYAPPTENNTSNYLDTVSRGSGIAPDQNLRASDIPKIAPFFKQMETGVPANSQQGGQTQQTFAPNYNQQIQATPRETSLAALDKLMPGIGKLGEQEQAARIAPLQAAQVERAKLPTELAKESTKDFFGKDQDVYQSALSTKANMAQLSAQIDNLNQTPGYWATGAGAEGRLAVAKGWNATMQALGADPSKNKDVFFDPAKIGTAEDLNSQSTIAGMQAAKEFYGGQREAQQIIQQTIKTKPGMGTTYEGAKRIISAFDEASNYNIDKRNFQVNWLQSHPGDLTGANEAFNTTNPPEKYSQRAVSQFQPIKINTASGKGQLLPGTRYQAPDGSVRIIGGGNGG